MHDNTQEQVLVLQNDDLWLGLAVVGCLEIGYTQKQVVAVIVFVIMVVVTLSLMMLNMWPMGLKKPAPIPTRTPTLGCEWGFPWVRVQVALENPRVACDNP